MKGKTGCYILLGNIGVYLELKQKYLRLNVSGLFQEFGTHHLKLLLLSYTSL